MRVFALLIALLLSSCVVGVTRPAPAPAPAPRPQPAPQPAPPPQTVGFVVNARLGLPAYPGGASLKREERGGGSEAEFATRDDLDEVYGFFHNWLASRGWARVALERKSAATKLEATYQRSSERFRLSLDKQGNSGRYKLEIDF